MLDFSPFFQQISEDLAEWGPQPEKQVQTKLANHNDGNLRRWQKLLANASPVDSSEQQLNQSWIKIGKQTDLNTEQLQQIHQYIQGLMPWRKGPFNVFDIKIDSEWRSDYKWDRIVGSLSDMQHQTILDVGCGNGYHCLRMKAMGAKHVMGIDPLG